MRKRISDNAPQTEGPENSEWLDLDALADVEITSEDDDFPIEGALIPRGTKGWKAKRAGAQRIRLSFDAPQRLQRIRLVFTENEQPRTQEFTLTWSQDGQVFHEIVRQQYNLNPPGTETEEYHVGLERVKALELNIIPDMSGGGAVASLSELRLR
jgi:hypothetical protein